MNPGGLDALGDGEGVAWYRGVPWLPDALTSAVADGVAGPVTEVAREFILMIEHDPTRVPPRAVAHVSRGDFTAVVSPGLVVVGHVRPGKASAAPARAQPGPVGREAHADRPTGRGPKDYRELGQWLEDEGYQVIPGGNRHPVVINRRGARLVHLSNTPSDNRSFKNDVATCRKVLGIPLRRDK